MARSYKKGLACICAKCDKPQLEPLPDYDSMCECTKYEWAGKLYKYIEYPPSTWKYVNVWDNHTDSWSSRCSNSKINTKKFYKRYRNGQSRRHDNVSCDEMVKEYNTNGDIRGEYPLSVQTKDILWDII